MTNEKIRYLEELPSGSLVFLDRRNEGLGGRNSIFYGVSGNYAYFLNDFWPLKISGLRYEQNNLSLKCEEGQQPIILTNSKRELGEPTSSVAAVLTFNEEHPKWNEMNSFIENGYETKF